MPGKVFTYAIILISSALLLSACSKQSDPVNETSAELEMLLLRITDLEAETARIQDSKEIKTLQRAYGYYVDQALWDEVAELFTDDGSMELALDGVYQGKARIREMLYQLGNGVAGLQYGQLNEHMQFQPVVTIDQQGVTARARWRALIMAGQYSDSALLGEGIYENEYRKENGTWKISKLHWYQTFIVPYEGGWSDNEDATGGILVSAELPPDQPPTEKYEVWPGVFVPPFHYTNPVSGRK